MSLKIYDWHKGPYPARVRIVVAEKGIQSQTRFVSINLRNGEHKTDEFRAKNYSGTLPVLELDDGTLIAECTAIRSISTLSMVGRRSRGGRLVKRA